MIYSWCIFLDCYIKPIFATHGNGELMVLGKLPASLLFATHGNGELTVLGKLPYSRSKSFTVDQQSRDQRVRTYPKVLRG
jgi:hypothetical protein